MRIIAAVLGVAGAIVFGVALAQGGITAGAAFLVFLIIAGLANS